MSKINLLLYSFMPVGKLEYIVLSSFVTDSCIAYMFHFPIENKNFLCLFFRANLFNISFLKIQ